ncbi:MAG TPA: hypothetical protein VMZ25_05900, partial [Terriglobales bacterium]|nr:hypothetical protein [Terriglobales bacterium]
AAAMNSFEHDAPLAVEETSSPEADIPVPVEVQEIPAPVEVEEIPAPVMMEVPAVEEIAPEPAVFASSTDTQKIQAVAEEMVAEDLVPEPEIAQSQLPPDGMQDAALVEQMQQAFADLPVASPTPVEEPVAQGAAVSAAPAPAVTTVGPDLELANALAAAVGGEPQMVAPVVTAAAAAGGPGLDPHTIAAVVSRVMERMLPSIMTEMAKELDNAKK